MDPACWWPLSFKRHNKINFVLKRTYVHFFVSQDVPLLPIALVVPNYVCRCRERRREKGKRERAEEEEEEADFDSWKERERKEGRKERSRKRNIMRERRRSGGCTRTRAGRTAGPAGPTAGRHSKRAMGRREKARFEPTEEEGRPF